MHPLALRVTRFLWSCPNMCECLYLHGMKGLFYSLCFASIPLLASAKDLTREQIEFFEKKVRPVLVNNCYRCHSKEATSLKGSLYLDSRSGVLSGGEAGPAIILGKPEQSLLFKAVSYQQSKLKMPPKTKLADKDIRILEAWIKMGAPDPRVDDGKSICLLARP